MPESSDSARGYVVSGRVQGVGFRWWTRRKADAAGVAGTVRNVADGTVEVMIRGPEEAVDAVARALHEGPPFARVDSVREIPCELPADTRGFSII